ncbi:circadian clock KaiB family protein [Tautonia plasticadhaerens]|uniref:Circadian clock protein KaiB n=1 Tax=Tautonia plasticadhaerens TaxID=2527974 RepID=A0A518HCD3_9BACT|nr:circadian clock KaiB family protein [Tautonia plasticadhaerens]QDV38523.1 Circadian clock protein KaiB [Tautonia plasticadhaerens]
MDRYLLKLYVTGLTSRSQRAMATLRRLCEAELAGHYELLVVDVLERPELAERDKVLATPTLIKELPEPERRIIGDLSDPARVLAALELQAATRPSEPTAAEAD